MTPKMTYQDEQRIKKCLFDNIDIRLDELLEVVIDWFGPEELYGVDRLNDWALMSGYVKKDGDA